MTRKKDLRFWIYFRDFDGWTTSTGAGSRVSVEEARCSLLAHYLLNNILVIPDYSIARTYQPREIIP